MAWAMGRPLRSSSPSATTRVAIVTTMMTMITTAITIMEWYGAFALLVTLVWLYLEILRLLSKLQQRN